MPDVLYVGFQKTGSTFLRGYLKQRGDVLLTRGGMALQRLGTDSAAAVGQSYLEMMARNVLAAPNDASLHVDMYEGLMGYMFRGDTTRWQPELMMSAEPLASADVVYDPAEFTRRMVELLPRKVRVIVTIRNQIDFIDSNYRHYRGRFGDGYDLVTFLGSIEGRLVAAAAAYDRLIGMLMDHLESGHLLVMPLEAIAADEGRAICEICGFLGIEPKPYDGKREVNAGAGYELRRSGWLGKILPALGLSFACRVRPLSPPNLRERRLLHAMYAGSNALLCRRIGRDLSAMGYLT